MKKVFITLTFILLSTLTFSQANINQQNDPNKFNRLERIYRNLEYNTIGFNDLKTKWVIIDPVLVRTIFNSFIVKNALRIEGKKPSLEYIKDKSLDVHRGEVFIDIRKRYYDNEIDFFRFYSEANLERGEETDMFFDPIEDFVQLRHIVGEKNYELLKAKMYAYNDLTKTYYDNKLAFKFDVLLNMFEPHVRFYNFTTNDKNKYLIGISGKWGYDNIALPGWYSPTFNLGTKVTYIDRILNNKPADVFEFEGGIGLPIQQTILDKDIYTGKRLHYTGASVYFNFTGNFLRYIGPEYGKYNLSLEGALALSTLGPTEINSVHTVTTIYSQRNLLSLTATRRDFLELSSFGHLGAILGVGIYDIGQYLTDDTQVTLTEVPQADGKLRYYVNAAMTIGKDDALFAYSLEPSFMYNIKESNAYFGFKASLLINNSFGFTFKFYSGIDLGSAGLPAYRSDSYIVFSPILRINY
ncbi:MAG: hypothetical protein IAE91_11870 [Ignavibacteriaceae bacterium]|nr:hypothetical protein [Ignavibacteriaceae bacterium]